MTRFWLFLRRLLVGGGIAVVVLAVRWGDGVQIPAGKTLAGMQPVDASRYQPVDAAVSLNNGSWQVELSGGRRVPVPGDWFRPGLLRMLAGATGGMLVIGLALVGLVHPLQATRWWLLLRARQLHVPWIRTLQLVYVGAFSNFLLPGTEGGDLVKAWAAAKGTDRRIDAVMSVIFDRITGLIGLAILAVIFGAVLATSDIGGQVHVWTWGGLVIVFVVAIICFVSMLRGWLRLPGVVANFGGGLPGKLQTALRAYGRHPGSIVGATGLSIVVQLLLASAAAACAWSVGSEHTIWMLLAVMPVLFLAAAVPLTWQGVGVMEALGIALLVVPGLATVNQVIATLVLYRVLELSWSLVGGLLLLRGDLPLRPVAASAQ
jgi:uncharacterized membrane protein YbhN (UPF0104 family)